MISQKEFVEMIQKLVAGDRSAPNPCCNTCIHYKSFNNNDKSFCRCMYWDPEWPNTKPEDFCSRWEGRSDSYEY